MVAFPGWLPHSVQATANSDSLRIWKTGLIITRADITGLLTSYPGETQHEHGQRCQVIDTGSPPGTGLAAIRAQFLTSMNTLADANSGPGVRDCDIAVQVWRGGYDRPAFSGQSRYIGWTVLAASTVSNHSESGCLTFADPRAGSAGTAMPACHGDASSS